MITVKIDTRGDNFDEVKIETGWVKLDRVKTDTT